MIYLIVLLFIIFFVTLILTLKIKFEIENFVFKSDDKKHIKEDYIFIIKLYLFYKIPIYKIKITQEKIQKIFNNKKIKQGIEKGKIKFLENRKDVDKDILKYLKKIKIKLEQMNLEISLGTENASLTAILVPFVTSILMIVLKNKLKKYDENQKLLIKPLFINQNILNITFSGIFEIKLIHIINAICIVNKKRKGDKYDRTSNRRSYDYGYEQY